MSEPPNPYQPPSTITDDARGSSLRFTGTIEEPDFTSLIPRNDFESLIIKLLLVLLWSISLLFSVMALIGLAIRGWHPSLTPVSVLIAILISVAIGIQRYSRPPNRARRELKRHPDLLGIVSGQLNEHGLTLHDGVTQHWFGPRFLGKLLISENGIRVLLGSGTGRHLSLTARLFESYSPNVAKRIQERWDSILASPAVPGQPTGIEQWEQLSPAPDQAVTFEGHVSVKQPMRHPSIKQSALITLGFAGILLAMNVAMHGSETSWTRYGLIGFCIYSAITGCWQLWQYYFGQQQIAWNQQGWISSTEMAIVLNENAHRFALAEIVSFEDHATLVVLRSRRGQAYYLSREHVKNEQSWETLNTIVRASCKSIAEDASSENAGASP